MIKIHIFHTGKVRVDVAIPYKTANPLAVTGFMRGDDKKIDLPVSCYLIEYPRGRVLIDSGWNSKYVTEKPHRFFGLLDQISTPILKDGESIDCQLADMGVKPADIDYLFLVIWILTTPAGWHRCREYIAYKRQVKKSRTQKNIFLDM